MKQFPLKSTLTAALVLAISLTFSCSGGDDDGTDPNGGSSSPSSSPSGVSSSSVAAPSSSSVAVSSSSSKPSSSSGASSSSVGVSSNSGGNNKCNSIANCKTKQIGSQTWMAENLNIDVPGSVCYDNDPANCAKYGRLYDWSTAMDIDAKYNSQLYGGSDVKHKGVCPTGWHIPSNAEWDRLYRYADGTSGTDSPYSSPTAGRYLKAREGWNGGGNGEDTYGFSALPGGYGGSDGSFFIVGSNGI